MHAIRAGVAGALIVGAGVLTIAPAQAAVGSESRSSAQFLDATLLGGDLSSVAGIDGAQAQYVDGTTAGTSVVDDAPLDVTALSALTVPLPTATSVGQLLDLGLVTQQAEADPDGVSSSHTETTGLRLNLNSLLGSVSALGGVIDTAGLDLGAVGSTASVDASDPGSLARSTEIANANLTLHSPAVGTLTNTVNTTVQTLTDTLNSVGGTLQTALNTALGATGANVGVNVDLASAVAPLLSQTISANGVSIDLSTGTISVNLAHLQDADGAPLLDLNNLPPNSTLLSPAVLQNISAQVSSLLSGLQTQIDNIVDNALDYVDVSISGGVDLGLAASVTLDYDGSLGDLLNDSSGVVTGSGVAGSVLAGTVNTALGVVLGTIGTTANTAVSQAATAVDGAVTTATNALAPALEALTDVAAVNLNVQNDSDGITSQADVTAVQVTLLPNGSAVTLNLATSTVGPNAHQAYSPTLTASSPVESGDATTVTGDGWPPNTAVALQLTGPNGDPVGAPVSVTTDANGALPAGTTVPVPAGSAVGTYAVAGTAPGGLTATAPFQVVDTIAPAAPVITGPASGTTTNDDTPTINGTGEPGDTVTVTVTDENGNTLGTATVGTDGTWSFDSNHLDDGTYTITATQTDPAGNTSPASAPDTFTVDTTAPDAPVITGPTDGSTVGDNTPPITGTGEPGDTVIVTDEDGNTVGTATVGSDGSWNLTPTIPFDDGQHTITSTQTDPAGNTSLASDPTTFTVDTTESAPVIQMPTPGTVTNDSTPTISGTGDPGTTLTVTTADETVLGTTTVGTDGTWSFDSNHLDDGTYTITASQTDGSGNTSPSSNSVVFTVDTTAGAPVITSPADGSTVGNDTPPITGTGEPDATVTVTDENGNTVGTATVGDDSTWTVTPTTPFDDGQHTITATQTDPAGNTSPASAPDTFTVDTTAPDAPVITGPTDGSSVHDHTPTISGIGEPGDTVTVTDQDGDVLGTATVDGNGTWSLDSTHLDDGTYTITATQKDPAGNTSPASAPSTFVVDTTAPDAPVITAPADGTTTNDTTPTINGTGEPGDTVTVTDQDGRTVGTTTVAPNGTWTVTPTNPLPDGTTTLTATQTDPAGNTSPASDPVTITVDTTAKAPVITKPADGSTTTNHTPTVTGTGEPGAEVAVTIDGTTIGTTKVGPGGNWSLPVTTALADGSHVVVATQTDAVGNISPAATSTFTVAPAAPTITSPSNGDTVSSTPIVKGSAPAGSTVDVLVDGKATGSTHADTSGAWSVTLPQLACGKHTLTATASTPGRLFDAFAHPAQRATSAGSNPVHVKVPCTASPGADKNSGTTSAGSGSGSGSGSGATTDPAADTDGGGATLPNTGAPANAVPVTALAGLLLLGGLALIGMALHRRHEHE